MARQPHISSSSHLNSVSAGNSTLVEALRNARELKRAGRLKAAASICRGILNSIPGQLEALNLLGLIELQGGRGKAALRQFERALKISPDSVEASTNRAHALESQGRHTEALAAYEKALALNPASSAELYYNRGVVLRNLERLDDALESFEQALILKPELTVAHYNCGLVLREFGRFKKALEHFEQAVAAEPGFADAHYNEGLCRLVLGDFEQGWEKHEWRWRSAGFEPLQDFDRPLWLGNADLSGKTLLIHSEQGLGDTIQFCRYATLASQCGARVVLGVQPSLKPLLESFPGVERVIATGDALPDFDFHCPLLSLPLAFKTTLSTIPAEIPYITASEEKIAQWRERLNDSKSLRVGLVWSGNPVHRNDRNRSMRLEELAMLMDADVDWISLQKVIPKQDRATYASMPIRDCRDQLRDFSDTAAIVDALDLVITVDTAVAHLAGAMGKPVWVLLPLFCDWRWLLQREDTPWYPSMRLFRQMNMKGWDPVVERLISALTEFAAVAGNNK